MRFQIHWKCAAVNVISTGHARRSSGQKLLPHKNFHCQQRSTHLSAMKRLTHSSHPPQLEEFLFEKLEIISSTVMSIKLALFRLNYLN